MFDVIESSQPAGKIVSHWDEPRAYDPVEFDPEETIGDDGDFGDIDSVALRDAARDIVALEGRFEVLMY
jgi:hypothetical protein